MTSSILSSNYFFNVVFILNLTKDFNMVDSIVLTKTPIRGWHNLSKLVVTTG